MTNNPTSENSDPVNEWVATAAHDRDSFGKLFDHFHPQIFAYCLRRLLVRAVAEDVASEVFLKAARGIGRFPGTTTEDFRRWIYRIATNEVVSQLRVTSRQRELLESAARMGLVGGDVMAPLVTTDLDVRWEQVYQELGHLSEREQSIISMRFFGSLSHEQISGVLELKTGTARVILNRALNKLRDRLRESVAADHSTTHSSRKGYQQ